LASALGERPHPGTEATGEPQDPETSQGRPGQNKPVHALIDKGVSRKHLDLAWEKGQKTRGRAGIDAGTSAQCEARQACSVDLLHRQLREGTYRPQPVQRVELPKAEGGVSKLGIPAVLARVGPQALGQRLEPSFDPTCLESAVG
jgi:RNA-directed DNA polymerase